MDLPPVVQLGLPKPRIIAWRRRGSKNEHSIAGVALRDAPTLLVRSRGSVTNAAHARRIETGRSCVIDQLPAPSGHSFGGWLFCDAYRSSGRSATSCFSSPLCVANLAMEERLRGTADRTDLVRTASTVFEQTPLAPIPASVRIFTTRWKLIALRRRIRRMRSADQMHCVAR